MQVPERLQEDWEKMSQVERSITATLLGLFVLALGAVLGGVLTPAYFVFLLGLGGMYALLSLGLNAQWGFTGLINFSVAAFFGIGAYGTALMTGGNSPIAGGFNPLVGLVVALIATAVIALLIGIPTLSLRDDYLAIASLGLAEVVRLVALNQDPWTNGSAGVRGIPPFFEGWPVLDGLPKALPGFRIELVPGSPLFLEAPFYTAMLNLVVVGAFIGVTYFALRRAHRAPWGRLLRTIRSDEDLAKALGKNTYWYKMQAFVLGCLVMALAGVFYAHLNRYVEPGTLDPITTFYVWVAVMLGGSGSNRGALLGGFVIVAIREGTRSVDFGALPLAPASVRLLVIGLLIILVMRFRPEGILPPQRELIWPGTTDEAPTGPDSAVREARGGTNNE